MPPKIFLPPPPQSRYPGTGPVSRDIMIKMHQLIDDENEIPNVKLPLFFQIFSISSNAGELQAMAV